MFNDSPVTDLAQADGRGRLRRNQQPDMPWRYGDDDDDEPEEDPARAGRIQKLMNLIQESIAPDSWVDRGGSIGTMKEIIEIVRQHPNGLAVRDVLDMIARDKLTIKPQSVSASLSYAFDKGLVTRDANGVYRIK